jgi:uncharacterized membrane protein
MVRFSRGLLMILVITALISCAQAATVYGTIYSWSDFEKPLKNAILEINTIPVQSSDVEIKDESDMTSFVILVLILIVMGFVLYYLSRKKKTPVSATESILRMPEVRAGTTELPEDLDELYALIMKKGGRVTQKELRGEMKCSEAKVSLMLDDLEDRGYLKKIKKGRSNIIIAQSKK